MNDEPFARIISAVQPKSEVQNVIGVVTSKKPLKVKIGDLEIDKDNIMINPYLLQHKRKITMSTISEPGDTNRHTHEIDWKKKEITIEPDIEVGDKLFIYRFDQLFLIICKVVNI